LKSRTEFQTVRQQRRNSIAPVALPNYPAPVFLFRQILDLAYPPICYGCEQPTTHLGFCDPCRAAIPPCLPPGCRCCGVPFAVASSAEYDCTRCRRQPPAFERARARFLYRAHEPSGPLQCAVQRFKYGRDVALARILGPMVADAAAESPARYDWIAPVPLHRDRLRWRGFNQALLLARAIGQRTATPVAPRLLVRTRPTAPQVELDEIARRRNVADAFAVTEPERVQGARILLVDDILTTGATVNECSRALRRARATRIDVLVLARAVAT